MARLTRAESQAHTRRRLLATATALFLRDGFTATSLERVADEAGFSKGAVYSNFRNKDELCLAVLDGVRAEKAATVGEALSRTESLEDLLRVFTVWAEGSAGDQEWIRLEAEYLLNCRRDPALLADLARSNAGISDRITQLLTTNSRRLGVRLPMDVRHAAHALFGITIGLGLLRSADPAIGAEPFTAVVRLLAQPAAGVSVPEARAASGAYADPKRD
ncbi:TetR/AcrR family transcriptional regulator [Amycolatopsis endophytica]|uniref:AcrR family transcriptional regulator n=1 Tax=Amycolatopsis endophytica TaxID=860233 RepID=A0A853B5F7_9PSEU|nr:TetR/AcrR family transcriptional regulator [Amycolatopsis endophytica]NYI90004.1 AcrR family transcriptional regulator [Amycolatopsis endophytica]